MVTRHVLMPDRSVNETYTQLAMWNTNLISGFHRAFLH